MVFHGVCPNKAWLGTAVPYTLETLWLSKFETALCTTRPTFGVTACVVYLFVCVRCVICFACLSMSSWQRWSCVCVWGSSLSFGLCRLIQTGPTSSTTRPRTRFVGVGTFKRFVRVVCSCHHWECLFVFSCGYRCTSWTLEPLEAFHKNLLSTTCRYW